MITLAEEMNFLRPNVEEATILVSAKKTLDLLKKVKLNELENNYIAHLSLSFKKSHYS